MPFYIRKHIDLGPLRVNLSKSGVGVSAGVTGLRVGLGPRGAHIHTGRKGLYYRKQIGWARLTEGSKKRQLTHAPGDAELGFIHNASLDMLHTMEGYKTFLADLARGSTGAEKDRLESLAHRTELAAERQAAALQRLELIRQGRYERPAKPVKTSTSKTTTPVDFAVFLLVLLAVCLALAMVWWVLQAVL